jgi:hypothetical protein
MVPRLQRGAPMTPTPTPTHAESGSELWQRLLHCWFVQYNPIYLVSATLVLGGMIATSRGLAHEGSLYGPLGVALIAELYACALIGGAALLTRIGQRRPAVMLALITVLYQSDLTLHTETCALLGGVGVIAGVAWLAIFAAKLHALAWAVRVRLAPRAVATALLGALGLVLLPHVLSRLDARAAGAVLAVFVYALGSLAPGGASEAATSLVPLDAWAAKVLARSVRATWSVWGVLLALHALFWSTQHPLFLGAVVPAFALLALRRVRREAHVWVALASSFVVVLVVAPSATSACAFAAAVALAQRAFSRSATLASLHERSAPTMREQSPYRNDEPAPPVMHLDVAARARLLAGALFGLYASIWTLGWSGGALPPHLVALDAALVVAVAALVWRLRARLALAPLAAIGVHAVFASGLVPPPRSLLEWGAASVVLGFLLLVISLVTSYRLRHLQAPAEHAARSRRAPSG